MPFNCVFSRMFFYWSSGLTRPQTMSSHRYPNQDSETAASHWSPSYQEVHIAAGRLWEECRSLQEELRSAGLKLKNMCQRLSKWCKVTSGSIIFNQFSRVGTSSAHTGFYSMSYIFWRICAHTFGSSLHTGVGLGWVGVGWGGVAWGAHKVMFTCTHKHWPLIMWGGVRVGWGGVGCGPNNVHDHLHTEALTTDPLVLGTGAICYAVRSSLALAHQHDAIKSSSGSGLGLGGVGWVW